MAVPNVEQRLDVRNSQLFCQNFDSLKKNSEQFSVNLRKKKRQENSIQKRFKPQDTSGSISSRVELFCISFKQLDSRDSKNSALKSISEVLSSPDSVGLTSDHLSYFLNLLKSEEGQAKILVTDVFINLTYNFPEFNEDLVRKGIFLALSPFLSMHQSELCRNAIWILTNLMIETRTLKARFVTSGLLECLVELIQIKTLPASTLSIVIWSLDAFSEQVLKLSEPDLNVLIQVLKGMIKVFQEKDSIFNVLGNIFRGRDDLVGVIMDKETCTTIVQGLSQEPSGDCHSRIKLISYILASEDSRNCAMLIEVGVLSELFSCLSSSSKKVRSEALFCFSNIAAEKYEIKKNLVNQQLVEGLLVFLTDDDTVSLNSAIILRNLSVNLPPADIQTLVNFRTFDFISANLGLLKEKPCFKELLNFLHFILTRAEKSTLDQISNSSFVQDLSEVLIDFRYCDAVALILGHFSESEVSSNEPAKFDI